MLNLDTHILLYALNGELTSKERQTLGAQSLSISAIIIVGDRQTRRTRAH